MAKVRELDITLVTPQTKQLAATFADRLVGQDDAKEALTQMLEKVTSGMFNKDKPIGSLLFMGPTGSGKTLAFETFCEGLFGTTANGLKVDCGEFQHSHEIAKLIGSPPGYLGHRETHPFFTNASMLAARQNAAGREVLPFTPVLFDEIEKASDALWNLLLGILDKGLLTTGTNERVDFKRSVIILTSNIGSAEIANENALGFQGIGEVMDDARAAEVAIAAAKRKFMPEFLNRLDRVVYFKTLTRENLEAILDLEIKKLQKRILFDSNVIFDLEVSDAAKKQLLDEGYEKRYNARALNRTMDKRLTTPLTRLVSTRQVKDNDTVLITYQGGEWKYAATHPRDC